MHNISNKISHTQNIEELLKVENENMHKMHKIVAHALKEEKSIVKMLYEHKHDASMTFSERIADGLAKFAGSWSFILFCIFTIMCWTSWNIFAHYKFDQYPFTLLNLFLSCIAALQGPVILMSQNRKETKDRKRSEDEYLVNLKAEIQVRELNKKIDLLMTEQMEILFEIAKENHSEMTEQMKAIKKKISDL